MNYRYGDVARSMEELPELLGRLEQLRFVEWDTHGAWLVVFWGVSRAVSTRPILMRLSAMTPRPNRSTTSAGVESRPRVRLLGRRFNRTWWTMFTNSGSSIASGRRGASSLPTSFPRAKPAGLARTIPHPAATDGNESQPRGLGEPERAARGRPAARGGGKRKACSS